MINLFKNLFKQKESKSIAELLKPIGSLEKKPTFIEIDLPVQGNSQLDNKAFKSIPPSSQCGYTTLAVLLSQFIPQAKDDKFIFEMINYFEKDFLIGKGNRFGASMANHVFMAEFFLKKYGVNRKVNFYPHSGTVADIIAILNKGYVIGVAGMMTKSGHFMTITGYSESRRAFKVADPYRLFDFEKGTYSKLPGLNAYYPIAKFMPYLEQSSTLVSNGTKKGIRYYYIGDTINE